MNENIQLSDPQDICLLLRAHGEQRWLTSEVLPVLRQIETPGSLPEDQRGAALAYLELLWLDARQRARETDAACAKLLEQGRQRDQALYERARGYCAAVRGLRGDVSRRVARRMMICLEPIAHEHASR